MITKYFCKLNIVLNKHFQIWIWCPFAYENWNISFTILKLIFFYIGICFFPDTQYLFKYYFAYNFGEICNFCIDREKETEHKQCRTKVAKFLISFLLWGIILCVE